MPLQPHYAPQPAPWAWRDSGLVLTLLAQVLRENRQLDHTRLQAVVRDVEREFFLVG